MMHKYEIVIWWSEEDQLFLACAPELGSSCTAHGDSPEAALREINALIPFWLDVLREEGRPVPEPKGTLVPVAATAANPARKPLRSPSKTNLPRSKSRKTHVETQNAV